MWDVYCRRVSKNSERMGSQASPCMTPNSDVQSTRTAFVEKTVRYENGFLLQLLPLEFLYVLLCGAVIQELFLEAKGRLSCVCCDW